MRCKMEREKAKMKQLIKIKFVDDEGKPRGKEYCYYCTVPTIALGDYVKAPVTPQSENDMPSRKGIVTKINVPEQEIEPFKQYAKTITESID